MSDPQLLVNSNDGSLVRPSPSMLRAFKMGRLGHLRATSADPNKLSDAVEAKRRELAELEAAEQAMADHVESAAKAANKKERDAVEAAKAAKIADEKQAALEAQALAELQAEKDKSARAAEDGRKRTEKLKEELK